MAPWADVSRDALSLNELLKSFASLVSPPLSLESGWGEGFASGSFCEESTPFCGQAGDTPLSVASSCLRTLDFCWIARDRGSAGRGDACPLTATGAHRYISVLD